MLMGCCTPAPENTNHKAAKKGSLEATKLGATREVSGDKMVKRRGLWYVKGGAKPFSGRVTLWAPGHGNEIGRQVVKTYVKGKERGSKVFRIIGKQAPRPNR